MLLGYPSSVPLSLPKTIYTTSFHVSILSSITEDTDYNSFWKVESMGTEPVKQKRDVEFLQQYMDTNINLQPDGAYNLKFP